MNFIFMEKFTALWGFLPVYLKKDFTFILFLYDQVTWSEFYASESPPLRWWVCMLYIVQRNPKHCLYGELYSQEDTLVLLFQLIHTSWGLDFYYYYDLKKRSAVQGWESVVYTPSVRRLQPHNTNL